MADPFVAEIRIFGFNFAPTGWAKCDGQLLAISQNTALFSLLGTTYCGNGQSTFGLPDLRGRAGMQPGTGPGLTDRVLGESSGTESHALALAELPLHTHTEQAVATPANLASPSSLRGLARSAPGLAYKNTNTGLTPMSAQAVSSTGGGLPHNNMQPYLVLNFCIATQGVFPARP